MAKVGPNAVNLAIAEMIGQLLTFTTHPTGQSRHNLAAPKYYNTKNISFKSMLGKYCENEKFYNIYCSSWNYNRNVQKQRLFNQNMQFRAGYHHNAKSFSIMFHLEP